MFAREAPPRARGFLNFSAIRPGVETLTSPWPTDHVFSERITAEHDRRLTAPPLCDESITALFLRQRIHQRCPPSRCTGVALRPSY